MFTAENQVLTAFVVGLVSACSLPLGALTSMLWRPSDRMLSFLMALGAGALLAALTIDLVASALATSKTTLLVLTRRRISRASNVTPPGLEKRRRPHGRKPSRRVSRA